MFGRELRKARKSARLTQDQLARRVEELTGKNRRAPKNKKAPPRQRWGFVATLSRAKVRKTRKLEYTLRVPELSNFV